MSDHTTTKARLIPEDVPQIERELGADPGRLQRFQRALRPWRLTAEEGHTGRHLDSQPTVHTLETQIKDARLAAGYVSDEHLNWALEELHPPLALYLHLARILSRRLVIGRDCHLSMEMFPNSARYRFDVKCLAIDPEPVFWELGMDELRWMQTSPGEIKRRAIHLARDLWAEIGPATGSSLP